MTKRSVLIPLPAYGFDPTEVAIPWLLMQNNGFDITFLTPRGEVPEADRLMLTGARLGVWKSVLAARQDAVKAYETMMGSEGFQNPLPYTDVQPDHFDALYLPGGHDKGVIEYLESKELQAITVDFFDQNKIVGAICHGVVLAARSINPQSGKSVLYDYNTTALLKSQEQLAFNMTRLWLGDYYLTYSDQTVEDEVTAVLAKPEQFMTGPKPIFRDSPEQLQRGFVVKDRNYISARWPGDVYSFTKSLIAEIERINRD